MNKGTRAAKQTVLRTLDAAELTVVRGGGGVQPPYDIGTGQLPSKPKAT
jgi:hypothetical protein